MRSTIHRMILRLAFVAAGVSLIVACGPKSTTTSTAPRRNTSIMDTTELRGHNYSTVWDAISAQHADWLLPRGGPSGGLSPQLGVWIEGSVRNMGADYLRNLRPVDIRQVRRLSTTESLHTYSWPWGGLVITLR